MPYIGAGDTRLGVAADISQSIRDNNTMVFYCWASVEDGGPTLNKRFIATGIVLKLVMYYYIWTYHHITVSCISLAAISLKIA